MNRGGLARTDYGFVLVQVNDVWFSDGTQKEEIGRLEPAQELTERVLGCRGDAGRLGGSGW